MVCALKPSLVEWKRERAVNVPVPAWFLETFLGGMETPEVDARQLYFAHLETFLGGMETA